VRRLASFAALPARDRGLLLKAVGTVVLVRLGLRLFAVDRLRRWAQRPGAGLAPVGRIAWSARAASRALPGTTCLASAFALQRLLSRHGHASEVHIGVARGSEGFAAHAWLTVDGRVLVGGEEQGGFTPLLAWPSVKA
jgi:hypothetical protein